VTGWRVRHVAVAGRLAVVPLLTAACAGEPSSASPLVIQPLPTIERLHGEVIQKDEILGTPTDIAVVGEYLVVLDASNSPAVHVFRLGDGARYRSFGEKGSGPLEFRDPRSLDPVAGRAEFWIFDGRLQRLTHVDLGGGTITVGDRSVLLRSDQAPFTAVWTGDGSILSSGLFSAGRLARFDGTGRRTGTLGRVPRHARGMTTVVQHAYMGTLIARPDRRRFALLARHADRVEFFGRDGHPLETVAGPSGFLPVYKVRYRAGMPSMVGGEDLRFGYIAASATSRALYGLYSGRTRAELPGGAHYGTFVHEYDWDGKLRRVFKLDAYAIGIAVDPEGKTLYVSRLYPTPAILRYSLPPPG
jgi:hypothetical protein